MSEKLWTLRDRYGNNIYLTNERWEHITDPVNHPEMLDYEEELKETLRVGKRKQDPLNPQKYRYAEPFDNLAADNTHIIAIVLFRLKEGESGKPEPNNYVVTAYQKERNRVNSAMKEPNFNYDEVSDTLYISFEPKVKATGIELNDHILLRIDKQKGKAVGLTFFEYSLLTQKTEIGFRSFPLTGLAELSDDLRELVLDILQQPPVNHILTLSAYTPSIVETIPITSFEESLLAMAA